MGEVSAVASRTIGQGAPILFIHGWTMAGLVEARDFEPIFLDKTHYRRIYVDLPGMGGSPAGGIQDLDSILERVSTFIEQHILPSRFLLVGSSCGAYIARALVYKYAGAVDGLLLRVPVVEPVSSKRDIDPFVPAVPDERLLASLSDSDRANLGDIPVQTPDYIDILRQKAETTWLPAIRTSDASTLDAIRSDPNLYRLTSTMHSSEDPFNKPTLIVSGRHDTDVGYRDSWSLVACYPRSTFAVLDRASHGLPIDEPDLFGALVNDWVRRVEESQRPI